MKRKRQVGGTGSPLESRQIPHLNRHVPPLAHTAMYVWHKYWGRKTWNVVGDFIQAYCPPDGVVLDPFAGSGVVAMEALRHGRRAIVCDLLPVATEITRLTLKPVETTALVAAFNRVKDRAMKEIQELYSTKCRKCAKPVLFDCAIWKGDRCMEIRYGGCHYCGDRRDKACRPMADDLKLLKKIEQARITAWYPKNVLEYEDGTPTPFMKREHYESLDQVFTKRNLMALAWLMEAVEKEQDKSLRDFLKIAFTSMVHLCSRMIALSNPSPTSHHTSFSSTGWTQHSYWSAPVFMEQNVWNKFESAVLGHQGLVKAKEESNRYFSGVRFGQKPDDVLNGDANVYIHTGDCIDFMKKLAEKHGECVDYIFTDPPYDASVQYGELAYLWVAWLGRDHDYTETLKSKEIIRNERQKKPFETYRGLLKNAFLRMHEVLQTGRYLTLTFHNPTFLVRNSTIQAGVTAGFDFEKIHHQPLGQKSAKAMLQPFGSAQGDFYLRFHKIPASRAADRPAALEALRFEKIVIDTARRIIAERGEPTPYTILINAIDPELARNGHFRETATGLDVRKVLEGERGKEFVLVPLHLGEKKGKAWWFKNPASIPHLESIPLTERVEQMVLRKLQEQGRVTFTDMWKAVSEAFPNSLTSDITSIRDALETYARKSGREEWQIKEDFRKESVQRTHTRMIAILAEIGMARGLEIWIGRREQSDSLAEAFPRREGVLRQYVSRSALGNLENADNVEEVERIDVLWLRGNKIHAAFEVETTTSMTEALKRGSNVSPEVKKFMIIPLERGQQLQSKLKSPLFGDRFKSDSWQVICAERLDDSFQKQKEKCEIEALGGLVMPKTFAKSLRSRSQLPLFGSSSS